jgi:DNA topoisomerase-1
MLLRDSKRGPFLGCSSFPKCRSTRMVKKLEGANLQQVEALLPLLKEETGKAAALAAKLVAENPAASAGKAINGTTTDIDCEECGKPMVVRSGRRGYFLGCSGYPKCKGTMELPAKLVEELGIESRDGKGSMPTGGRSRSASEGEIEDAA